ncbi:UDP-glycosyltransferase UGT5-like isoform X20 [Planococcus citri]|uniref:UDP-glycosyltransferase UGT5-like isoform X20 n=1 Tax=Planococcus citri TaxID=170843 RepID=UPI0031F8D42A
MFFVAFFTMKIIFFLLLVRATYSYNILGIFTHPMKSHHAAFDPLMIGLAERGHQVTHVNTFPKTHQIANYHQVNVESCFTLPNTLSMETMKSMSSFFGATHAILNFNPSFEEVLSCQPLIELLNGSQKFDVLITEAFTTDFYILYANKLNIPVIGYHSNLPYTWHAERLGMPYNPSYIPATLAGFPPRMNFIDRMMNLIGNLYSLYVYDTYSQEVYNELVPKYFGDGMPRLQDAVKNTSLIFFYSYFAYSGVRPLVPNAVEVGGMHVKDSKPLPKNIEKFINESKHGVVYFCMGSLLRGETFPPEKREAFLYAFSKIPQRVLWKWEGDVLPGKSDNIMISKWMPQRDILAHPNVKLFISHGGLLGTSEAVYEGVPVLGIPIFGDQRTNIKSLEANGAGELLDYNEISKEVVLEKIQRLLNDPKYKENAKLLSDRYRDRPMSPLDTAVYWTEYVIRHKGAPHLRTAAADMPWYQYLLLDVIAFIVAVLVAGLLIIYYTTKFILRAIYGLICGGGAKKGSSKSDKKKRN